MEKLEPKHLAPYLPYGLKVFSNKIETLTGIECTKVKVREFDMFFPIENCKPILRPLSDLTIENMKEFSGGNFSRYSEDFLNSILETYKKDIKIQNLSYRLMQPLFENHFDICGLIEKGLAIDINTIQK